MVSATNIKEKIRRKRYVIKPGFQLRYTGIILFTVLAVALICVASTYYSSITLLGEKLAYVYPQGRLIATLQEINLIIVLRVLLLVPLVILAGIILSHKIAGPAFRIERSLREIGKGNFDIRVELRKYDELKGIADAINEMVENLKKMPNLKS